MRFSTRHVLDKIMFRQASCNINLFRRKKCTCDQPRIIIIGAGAAGIAAATNLIENNFVNVKILEAESRIGGRIQSVDFGIGKIDLGAQWCHGKKNNLVYESVKDLNLLGPTTHNVEFLHSSGQYISKKFAKNLYQISEEISDDMEKYASRWQTVGEYFSTKYYETILSKYGSNPEELIIAKDALEFFQRQHCGIDGARNWFDCAANTDYEYCEGDPRLFWKGMGFEIFLDVLTKKYPSGYQTISVGDNVLLSKAVSRIEWNINSAGQHTRITCNDGCIYDADYLIFTPSLGVLASKADDMFYPPLTEDKKSSIEKIGYGMSMKIFLNYSKRWWREMAWFQLIWGHKDIHDVKNYFPEGPQLNGRSWITYIYSINELESDPNILQVWITGPLVPEIERVSSEVIQKGINYIMDRFFGHLYKVSKPQSMIRTNWCNNPNFYGTYSFHTVNVNLEDLRGNLTAPLLNSRGKPMVQFAGEATSPYHFSTVHGAVESGFREAQRIVCYHKNIRKSNEISYTNNGK